MTCRVTGAPVAGGAGYAASVYVVVCAGETSVLPLLPKRPTPWLISTKPLFAVTQLNRVEAPLVIVIGSATKLVIDGGPPGPTDPRTVTVTVLTTEGPAFGGEG